MFTAIQCLVLPRIACFKHKHSPLRWSYKELLLPIDKNNLFITNKNMLFVIHDECCYKVEIRFKRKTCGCFAKYNTVH